MLLVVWYRISCQYPYRCFPLVYWSRVVRVGTGTVSNQLAECSRYRYRYCTGMAPVPVLVQYEHTVPVRLCGTVLYCTPMNAGVGTGSVVNE